MLTVYLLRHGQTAWNVERRFLGRTDIGLDGVGEAQAEGLGRVFPAVSGVWSSPLTRALQTAAAVRAQSPPTIDRGLVEMDMGVLEGLDGPTAMERHADLLRQFRADPTGVTIPEGETMAQAADRMVQAWGAIVASVEPPMGAEPRGIAIVSHQMAMAALLCRLTGSPLAAYQGFTQRNTAWTTVSVADPAQPLRVTLLARDQAPHLG